MGEVIDLNLAPPFGLGRLPLAAPPTPDNDPMPGLWLIPAPSFGDDEITPTLEVPRKPKFVAEDYDALEPLPIGWRIKGIAPAVGVGVLAGPSMSGKSFLALHALTAICQGRAVFGLKTKQCGGIYIAAEDAAGVRLRITALRRETGPLGGAFGFVGQAPDLREPDDIADIRALIEGRRAEMLLRGFDLGVVVIDTLSASIPGADENGSKDMSEVLSALQKMAQELGVLVLLVAHTGKDEARGIRGWSGFKANSDCVIMVEAPSPDGVRVVTADKVKNGQSGARFAFSLEVVTLGTDEDGDPITTCVVREEEAPDRPAKGGQRSLSPKQAILLRAIRLCVQEGETQPMLAGPGIPPGARGVLRAAAKDRAMREGYSDSDENPESVRRKLNDHIATLIERGLVRGQGDYLWLLE